MSRIQIVHGDITRITADAIVNAANKSLLGGGGVDGAIHRAAGPELLKECITLNGCKTGEAKITRGYLLPARFIIHTVGPRYRDGNSGEPGLLASCYQSCLDLAAIYEISTIAFPSISTGIYGYPIREAAGIALTEILAFLKTSSSINQVTIVCFTFEDLQVYLEEMQKRTSFTP
jgi:O-acetyl-ADP-ribose deacetylase (regulator of RNase III)